MQIDLLNKIIYTQTIDGLWKCHEEIAKLIDVDFGKLKDACPVENKNDTEMQDLWITSVVCAVLRKEYKSDEVEWKLIVKKAVKLLKKKKVDHFIEEANKFVEK